MPLSACKTACAHTLRLRCFSILFSITIGICLGIVSRSHSHDLLGRLGPRRVRRILALLRRGNVLRGHAHRRVTDVRGRYMRWVKAAIVTRLQICRLVYYTGQCNKAKARRPSADRRVSSSSSWWLCMRRSSKLEDEYIVLYERKPGSNSRAARGSVISVVALKDELRVERRGVDRPGVCSSSAEC